MKYSIFRLILAAAIVIAGSAILVGRVNTHLYLVTGLRTSGAPFRIPSTVVTVDEVRHVLAPIASLVDESQGINFIIADRQRRLVVIGSPAGKPTELVVLNMDAPATPRRIPISLDGVLIESFLFDQRDIGAVLALRTAKGTGRGTVDESLTGVDFVPENSTAAQHILPWTDYHLVRREGSWAPGDNPGGRFELTARDGKALTTRGGKILDMEIPFPKRFEAEVDQTFLLDVSNDDMLVIDRSKERGTGGALDPIGVTQLSIYDKKGASWDNVTFAGGGSSIRGFGPWVAVSEATISVDLMKRKTNEAPAPVQESPGAILRQRVLNPQARPQDQATVDGLFRAGPLYFPGVMHLYDIRSKKKYTINTGIGDSEVLLIEGSVVYYRVDDSLFRAQIGKNEIENAVEVVKDSNLQLAHWAFLGP